MQNYICSSCGNSFEADPDQKGLIVCASCGAELVESRTERPLPPGTRIKGFEILHHIASGGSGDVYLAEQVAMERKVALKILNCKHFSSEDIEQFFQEARNTARFENPHVIGVLEFGVSDDGYYYLATRYVDGETLEAILSRKRFLPEERALSIVISVAEVLNSVWEKNKMFHQDIKPANIMIAKDGEVVILDMGLAQECGTTALSHGQIEGSPYYMSPEQAHGEKLSWSTDLYSLGVTLYQAVTGVYPYDAEDMQKILEMHDTAPFPEPETRVSNIHVSPNLTALLRRMMGKKQEDRFTSWKEFIQVAQNILQELQKKNGSVPGQKKEKTKQKKNNAAKGIRMLGFGFGILFLLAIMIAGISLFLASQKNSVYAERLLRSVRSMMHKKVWDISAVEHSIERLEKHQQTFGVKPSLKKEIQQSRERLEIYKKENEFIAQSELDAAKLLQESEDIFTNAKMLNDFSKQGESRKMYRTAISKLWHLHKNIKQHSMILPGNKKRSETLCKQLRITIAVAQKEFYSFVKKQEENKKNEMKPLVKTPATVQKPSTPKTVQKPLTKPVAKKVSKPKANKPATSKKEIKTVVKDVKTPVKKKTAKPKKIKKLSPDDKLKSQREVILLRIMLLPEKSKYGKISAPENELGQLMQQNKNNEAHMQWCSQLKEILADAHKLWDTIYDSRTRFAGFEFTMSRHGMKMNTATIIRNTIYLCKDNLPNIKRTFAQINSVEWYEFVHYAAKKASMQPAVEAYDLLNGVFQPQQQYQNETVKKFSKEVKRIWFSYLTGTKYQGMPERKMSRQEIITRYVNDSDFEPFAEKIHIKYNNTQRKETKK